MDLKIRRDKVGKEIVIDSKDANCLLVCGTNVNDRVVFDERILAQVLKADEKTKGIIVGQELNDPMDFLKENVTIVDDENYYFVGIKEALNAMEENYRQMEKANVWSFKDMNGKINHVCLIINDLDEVLSQIKLISNKEYEDSKRWLISLAQKGRGAGVVMVLGFSKTEGLPLIKDDLIPDSLTRVAFQTENEDDSELLVGTDDAANLLPNYFYMWQYGKKLLMGSLN